MTKQPFIFISPSKYVQGDGAIETLGEHISTLGRRVLTIGGKRGLDSTREGRVIGLSKFDIFETEEVFNGESSDAEIERIAALARAGEYGVLMACGGGKAIDTVKAAAMLANIPCVVVPTVASNDSPCSALSVIYNEDGSFSRLMTLRRNPDVVLVDTGIIADAPVRQLVSGMGDALATYHECLAGYKSGALNGAGGHISQTALTLAKLCHDTIHSFGISAKIACEMNVVTPALEHVVEANTLLSGLGFESGSVALAHALSEGMSIIPYAHKYTHGELVAFCTLVQLVMEGRDEQMLVEEYDLRVELGLPVTLAELEIEPGELLRSACDIAAEPNKPSHNLPFPISGKAIYDAVIAVDAIGKRCNPDPDLNKYS